ncbi:hypothetical protein BCF33_2723 [Hasllibacter halocynthiae]|uniref:Uncharacterized protein n=1 Tax=Hasllibacter halocynthiae TaxID=595589 RepID=A0A2T0WZB8_9RHOB|nr:hypothetical protein [Hasllibacter halocynthiae]PRY92030.1 hypothetical protein BCF33_2723 [Hasllibacter halocynthiae]
MASSTAGRTARKGREAVSDATEKAKETAREVAADARARLEEAAEDRKRQAAERMERIAGAVHDAADALDGELGLAADYVHAGAGWLDEMAAEVEAHGIGELTDSVRRFARRQPLAVAGVAALVGFAALRFVTMPKADEDGYDYDEDEDEDREGDRGGRAGRQAPSGIPRSAFEEDDSVSGDPGGVAPEAPGFATDAEDDADGGEGRKAGATSGTPGKASGGKPGSASGATSGTSGDTSGTSAPAGGAKPGGGASGTGGAKGPRPQGADDEKNEDGGKGKPSGTGPS